MTMPAAAAPAERQFNFRTLFMLVLLAGVVHILSTFAGMNDRSTSAYKRLAGDLPANKMMVLPRVEPGRQPLPFMSSDARYAICHFDTTAGPVTVDALLPDHGWSLGVYRPDGSSAYFAAAPRGRLTTIDLTIVPADDRFLGLTPEAKGKINTGAPPLTVIAKEGLIIVRAPDKGLAYQAESEQDLAKSACAPKAY